MMDKNIRIYYEVTDGNGGWEYPTMGEAVQQLVAMRKGFLENVHMTANNRKYWIKARERHYIVKVTEEKERIL